MVYMDIPGLQEDHILVDVQGNILTVSGERKSDDVDEGKDHHYYRREIFYGEFHKNLNTFCHAENIN